MQIELIALIALGVSLAALASWYYGAHGVRPTLFVHQPGFTG